MSGFAIHANESIKSTGRTQFITVSEAVVTPMQRDVEWFRKELELRGVKGFELICGDYRENFDQIPPELMDRYLQLRPLKLHRTALETVLKEHKQAQAQESV